MESGLNDAGTCAANALGPCQSNLLGVFRGTLEHGNQGGYTLAFNILAANNVTRSLRSDHDDADTLGWLDQAIVDGQTVCESECLAFFEVRKNVVFVDFRLLHVRHCHHDDIRFFNSFCCFINFKALALRDFDGLTFRVETDDYIETAVLQVLGVCVAL